MHWSIIRWTSQPREEEPILNKVGEAIAPYTWKWRLKKDANECSLVGESNTIDQFLKVLLFLFR